MDKNVSGEICLDLEEFDDMEIVFQQDDAPPHFYRSVSTHSDQQYHDGCIGRRIRNGSIEWLARSPDKPMNFFL